MKYKKILATIGSFALVGATVAGAFAAAYPANMNADNTVVVQGTGAGAEDSVALNLIDSDLAGPASSGAVVVGSESVNIGEESANDLLLGSSLGTLLSDVTDAELPTLLAERRIRTNDKNIDYFQTIHLGNNAVTFGDLNHEENYQVNTNLADDLRPVLYVNTASGPLWTLEIEFDDAVNFTDLRAGQVLNIAGTEWSVDPSLSPSSTALVLFGAAQSDIVSLNEEVTFQVNGDSYVVEVTGGTETPKRVHVRVDGTAYRNLAEGDDFEHDGQKFVVNEISITSIGLAVDSIEAEIFAGADELEILATGGEVDVNGEVIRGLSANFTGGTVDSITSIFFEFTPSDLDAERDEFNFLEIGETIVDPVLGSIAVTFESASQDLKEGKEFFEINARRSDNVEVTLSNENGAEFVFVAYEEDDEDLIDRILLNGSSLLMHNGSDVTIDGKLINLNRDDHEKKFLILEERGASVVLEIDRVTHNRGEDSSVRFRNVASGATFTVEHGDRFLRNEYRLLFYNDFVDNNATEEINGTLLNGATTGGNLFAVFDADVSVTATMAATTAERANNVFEANNDVLVRFNPSDTEVASINITEHSDGDHTPQTLNFTIDLNDDDETRVVFDKGSIAGGEDDERDFGYYLTQLGSYIETEHDDKTWARAYVPEDTTEYNVYIGSADVSTQPGEAGSLIVSDTEAATITDKNLIVVGGSAINSIAASLLGLDYPAAGEAFTDATDVGAGQYLVQSFSHEGNVAVLVAGYNQADTENAARYLVNQNPDVAVGMKYVGSTATQASSVVN